MKRTLLLAALLASACIPEFRRYEPVDAAPPLDACMPDPAPTQARYDLCYQKCIGSIAGDDELCLGGERPIPGPRPGITPCEHECVDGCAVRQWCPR